VGDDGKAHDLHLAVHADDHFRHRAHADHVGPDAAEEAILRSRLQVRPGYGDEHAFLQWDLLLERYALGESHQLAAIGFAHIGKAVAEAVVVGANERVVAEQVDVIFDQHDVAARPLRIHAAAGIADDQV